MQHLRRRLVARLALPVCCVDCNLLLAACACILQTALLLLLCICAYYARLLLHKVVIARCACDCALCKASAFARCASICDCCAFSSSICVLRDYFILCLQMLVIGQRRNGSLEVGRFGGFHGKVGGGVLEHLASWHLQPRAEGKPAGGECGSHRLHRPMRPFAR